MTDNEKMSAYIFAAQLHPNAVPLLDLKKGDTFHWPNGNSTFTYSGTGWYKNARNVSFRANTKTAVIRKN